MYIARHVDVYSMDRASLSTDTDGREMEEDVGSRVYVEKTVDEDHALDKKRVSDVVHDFWSSSTLQGLPRVFTSKANFWKIFWLLMFLLLLSGCVYQVGSIVNMFFSREITTTYQIGYGNLEFPSVTVCNMNIFRKSEVEIEMKNRLDPLLWQFYKNASQEEDHGAELTYMVDLELVDYMKMNLSYEERLRIGHQQNSTILDAMFPEETDTPAVFSMTNSYYTGNCFTFNGRETQNQSLKAAGAGQNKGLMMLLYAESQEYLKARIPVRGFQLDIHKYNTHHDIGNIPITIPTGYMIHLHIRQSVVDRLESPYGECDQEYADSYRDIFGYDYTVEACNSTCFPYQLLTECGCFHAGYTKYYTKQQMTNHKQCAIYGKKVFTAYYMLDHPSDNVTMDTECVQDVEQRVSTDLKCSCPLPCREVRYRVEMSSVPLQQAVWSYVRNKLCDVIFYDGQNSMCDKMHDTPLDEQLEFIRSNFVFVKVYYLDLTHDHYKQNIAYEQSQFISDLGGTIGLWLGASIFTALELIELFTKIGVISMFRNNCTCSKKTSKTLWATRFTIKRKTKQKSKNNNNVVSLPLKDGATA